jgi:hypothetical protein
VSAVGTYNEWGLDSTRFFGPYDLRVGCYPDSVDFYSSHLLNTDKTLNFFVGDNNRNAVSFPTPTSTRAWCVVMKNEIV